MGYRRGVRVVESMGIFPLAEVARGHDWSWGQQDGQLTRIIVSLCLYTFLCNL